MKAMGARPVNVRRTTLLMAGAALALAGSLLADTDDDLAVVKKAVATAQAAPATPPAEEPLQASPPAPRGGKAAPRWLRVRVFERDAKGETRKRVSVNLPLSLVRALDDFPVDLCGHHHRWKDQARQDSSPCQMKVADVLAALEAGQELVEVEGEDATVKVWVE